MTRNDGFIIYPTYRIEDGKSYVYLFGRLKDGRSFCTKNSFDPYFFIKKEDLTKAKRISNLKTEDSELKSFSEEELVKIKKNIPREVGYLRKELEEKGIDCFEADIRFAYRFMMDYDLKGTVKIVGEESKNDAVRVDAFFNEPELEAGDWRLHYNDLKILSIDIEQSMDGKDFYCLSMVSNDKKLNKVLIISKDKSLKHAELFNTEKELLSKFREHLIEYDPDVVTGWNLIDFDLKVLEDRMKRLGINFDLGRTMDKASLRIFDSFITDSKAEFPGRMVLDGIHILKTSFIRLPDYKLETAAEEFSKEKKLIKGDNRGDQIEEAYKKNQQELVDYNLLDSKLVLEIIQNSGGLQLTIHRSLLTGMPLDRVRASIASFDSLYLRRLRRRGYVALSSKYTERTERTTGGYVMDPKPGIYSYVIVCDFKSLYPSIMRTFNIDPLMYRPGCKKIGKEELIKAPNGACFSKKEGILPNILQELWDERESARKSGDELTRWAIKILMNSMYGVLASPNCRFYSFDIANSITGFAHKIIKSTAKRIGDKGYEVIYGDSITKDRFITIKNDKGFVNIISVEDLFDKFKETTKIKGDKEFVIPSKEFKVLCVDEKTLKPKFSQIKAVIRHKTNKRVYRINQKYGETICSEDHSLIDFSKNKLDKIKPETLAENNVPFSTVTKLPRLKNVKKIDLYKYLKDYSYKSRYKGKIKESKFEIVGNNWIKFGWTNRRKHILLRRFINVDSKELDALCRILGLYVAEGSSSTPETTRTKSGASISTGNSKLLERIRKDYHILFKNAKTSIIESDSKRQRVIKQNKKVYSYNDSTLKLQMMNELSAMFFKLLAGQKSTSKKIPEFVYHIPEKYKKLLLKYMVLGDGSLYDDRYSKEFVKDNYRYTTKSLHLISGMTFLLRQLNLNYNIQYRPSNKSYRISTSNKNNTRLITKLTVIKYDNYLYDLSVEDENFVDSCGQILLHNTDSVFVNLDVNSDREASRLGLEIQKEINEHFTNMIPEEYGVESFLELEFEKTFKKFLMPMVRGSEVGAKKRYAGLIVKDGKESIDFTGLEFVRRDWTALSKKFQLEMLDLIFHGKEIASYVKKFVTDLKKGKYDDLLVYRKALRKNVDEYVKTTPPHVKAARKLGKLTSNIIDYVMTSDGPEPVQKVEHSIDYKHYIDKQIKPIADSVLVFFGQEFDNVVAGTQQKSLFGFG